MSTTDPDVVSIDVVRVGLRKLEEERHACLGIYEGEIPLGCVLCLNTVPSKLLNGAKWA